MCRTTGISCYGGSRILTILLRIATTTTGLLSNQVSSVVQDEQGYIWIGTTDGLQRF